MASFDRALVPHAVELDQVARHMLLRDDERNAALGEAAQRVAPSGFRRGIEDVVGLGRVKIVALDPGAVGRPRLVRVGGDNPADGRRHAMAREQFDHPMAVGVANGGRRVDDDRARLLHCRQAIQDRRRART